MARGSKADRQKAMLAYALQHDGRLAVRVWTRAYGVPKQEPFWGALDLEAAEEMTAMGVLTCLGVHDRSAWRRFRRGQAEERWTDYEYVLTVLAEQAAYAADVVGRATESGQEG